MKTIALQERGGARLARQDSEFILYVLRANGATA